MVRKEEDRKTEHDEPKNSKRHVATYRLMALNDIIIMRSPQRRPNEITRHYNKTLRDVKSVVHVKTLPNTFDSRYNATPMAKPPTRVSQLAKARKMPQGLRETVSTAKSKKKRTKAMKSSQQPSPHIQRDAHRIENASRGAAYPPSLRQEAE